MKPPLKPFKKTESLQLSLDVIMHCGGRILAADTAGHFQFRGIFN